ncbi:MAG: hypothetical protein FWE91_12915 [Defluviitaleaceae bacterium]|nr:hypothetical protein [Defluviitaleaceae bacterium]
MIFLFLNESFYIDHAQCTQIEQKLMRPYIQVYTTINGVQFAIPLRSGITHKGQVLWTDKAMKCGLDFTKAVVIKDEKYINKTTVPHIRQNEFNSLRGKEYIIKQKMLKHIAEYKKAKSELHIERNQFICSFSTMQYFEKYIEAIE